MQITTLESRFTRAEEGQSFLTMARAVQDYQRAHCRMYAAYGLDHLPVEAFKRVPVTTFDPAEAEAVFESSGTGQSAVSRHYVRCLQVYRRSVCTHFAAVAGPGPFTILAHLPGYAVQTSSLVCMVQLLMERFGTAESAFFLDDCLPLERAMAGSAAPIVLFGAAFGLLDLVDRQVWPLPADSLVIETGGMKTYRQAITRSELHQRLAEGFGLPTRRIWSEYGMCELMSQAYAKGGGVYQPPPWMRVSVVDSQQPDRVLPDGEPGALAVIDLANLYSVSWLLTEDLGVGHRHGFEVLGRLPASALRGCNFLIPSA
ncbi:MAG: hypothetical protein OXU68_12090 [Bacteroidota bacterium]|nr:hypothetical protein [Bacteroidota bacterium]